VCVTVELVFSVHTQVNSECFCTVCVTVELVTSVRTQVNSKSFTLCSGASVLCAHRDQL
jgi:hypothetical protein